MFTVDATFGVPTGGGAPVPSRVSVSVLPAIALEMVGSPEAVLNVPEPPMTRPEPDCPQRRLIWLGDTVIGGGGGWPLPASEVTWKVVRPPRASVITIWVSTRTNGFVTVTVKRPGWELDLTGGSPNGDSVEV